MGFSPFPLERRSAVWASLSIICFSPITQLLFPSLSLCLPSSRFSPFLLQKADTNKTAGQTRRGMNSTAELPGSSQGCRPSRCLTSAARQKKRDWDAHHIQDGGHRACTVESFDIMPLKLGWTIWPFRTIWENFTCRHVRMQPIRTRRDTPTCTTWWCQAGEHHLS